MAVNVLHRYSSHPDSPLTEASSLLIYFSGFDSAHLLFVSVERSFNAFNGEH